MLHNARVVDGPSMSRQVHCSDCGAKRSFSGSYNEQNEQAHAYAAHHQVNANAAMPGEAADSYGRGRGK